MNDQQQAAEVLRVTPEGEFVWHEDADRLIEEGDYSNQPAMKHILRALRKALAQPQDPVLITRIAVPESNVRIAQPQGEWVDLTEDEEIEIANSDEAEADNYNSGYSWQDPYVIIRLAIAKLKEKNTPPVVPKIAALNDAFDKLVEAAYQRGRREERLEALAQPQGLQFELCEDEGCPHHDTVHYCSVKPQGELV